MYSICSSSDYHPGKCQLLVVREDWQAKGPRKLWSCALLITVIVCQKVTTWKQQERQHSEEHFIEKRFPNLRLMPIKSPNCLQKTSNTQHEMCHPRSEMCHWPGGDTKFGLCSSFLTFLRLGLGIDFPRKSRGCWTDCEVRRPGTVCVAHATHSVMQIPEDWW